MLPDGRRLGVHLPLADGLVRATERAASIGASSLQVFTDNPTAWRRRSAPPRELPAFRERFEALELGPLAVHAPYLVNLATNDASIRVRSVEVLAQELRVAAAWGARFVNLHVGSHRGDGVDAGIDRVATGVSEAIARAGAEAAGVVVVLENGAGAGFGLGSTPDELARIDTAIAALGVPPERYGYCLDTAHAWGAGLGIGTADGVDRLVERLDAAFGIGRLRMIHLNDSKAEEGSSLDRHEHLGGGRIGAEGLARVIVHPALRHVAYYLETPGMERGFDAVNVARARALAEGSTLDPLPPEAFEGNGRRSAGSPPAGAERA